MADPEPTYDFKDFVFGEEFEEVVEYFHDEIEEVVRRLIERQHSQLKEATRNLLCEAFGKFKTEGDWWLSRQPASLVWEPAAAQADCYWCDDFPVKISVKPTDLVNAVKTDLAFFAEDAEELATALAEWRRAVEEAERLLADAMPAEPTSPSSE